jgi:hypothetical protein
VRFIGWHENTAPLGGRCDPLILVGNGKMWGWRCNSIVKGAEISRDYTSQCHFDCKAERGSTVANPES